jgi:RNA polymerase sigma-70 factor (ECF subfamily)
MRLTPFGRRDVPLVNGELARGNEERPSDRVGPLPADARTPARPALDRHPGGDHAAVADEALLAALAGGDREALALLYDRYGGIAYGLAYRIVQDRPAAEAIVQEVFLRAWHAAVALHAERRSVGPWLLSAVHRDARDRRRGRDNMERQASSWGDLPAAGLPHWDSWDVAEWPALREQFRDTLEGLAPLQRQALELAYFNGCAVGEIAARQGVPPGTVLVRLRLGLRALWRASG